MATFFRLLGRLEIGDEQTRITLGRRRERALLGVLLLQPGVVIPTERLIDLLWDEPPATAKASLHTHVARLRARVDPGLSGLSLRSNGRGYVAEVDASLIDVHLFTAMIEAAADLAEPGMRAAQLREALALWRGPLLADEISDRLRDRIGSRLAELRLTATALAVEADLTRGNHLEVIGELTSLIAEHPHHDQFTGQLMTALYRAGRQAEAIDVFQRARTRLADDLGIDPGPELVRLYGAMLRGELDTEPAAIQRQVPRQLPRDIATFVGRESEMAQLDGHLSAQQRTGSVGISVITGAPGVGKTALAVRWGHSAAEQFPDGQLYVDLRGYGSGPPLDAAEALHRLLYSLDAPSPRGPSDVEVLATAYRSLLAGRRLLIVLDNAVDPEQVRPMIPASPGCHMLVTTRDSLHGLVVVDDAHLLAVQEFTPQESAGLLTRLLGESRAAGETDAVDRLSVLCGHLPLALRIAAANLVQVPELLVRELVEELHSGNRLGMLSRGSDPKAALRTVFEHSYARLPLDARRLFRALGLTVGDDVTLPVLTVLTGFDAAEAARLTEVLAASHLLEERAPGRYRLHDLLRLYASELAAEEDDAPRRAEAVGRMYAYYESMVDSAARILSPTTPRLIEQAEDAEPPQTKLSDYAEALSWLDTERNNIIAIIQHSGPSTFYRTACRLIDALRSYQQMRRHSNDWTSAVRSGLDGARACGDEEVVAVMHTYLGYTRLIAGDYPAGLADLMTGLRLLRPLGRDAAEAMTLGNISTVHRILGDIESSLEYAAQALEAYERIGSARGLAMTLGNLGQGHSDLGRYTRAAPYFARSIACFQEVGDREGEANSENSLGITLREMGSFAEAAEHLSRASALYHDLGAPNGIMMTTDSFALLHNALGRHEEALSEALRAVSMAHEVGYRRTEADALNTAGSACFHLGRLDEAHGHHTAALQIAQEIGWKLAETAAHLGLAAVGYHPSRSDAHAAEHLNLALTIARESGYGPLAARARIMQATLASTEDAPQRLREVLADCAEAGSRPLQLGILRLLGRMLYPTNPVAAAEAWRAARELAVGIGTPGCYFTPSS